MKFFLALLFACFAVWLWRYVYGCITIGVVQLPKGNTWWREARYFERDASPIRFWFSVGLWVVLAVLVTAIPVVWLTNAFI